jgi:mannose/fructose-specific phosphotransferase system component IIA
MSEVLKGVLVGHGRLAEGLLDAVKGITGLPDGLSAVDNVGLTPEALEARLDELIGKDHAVVFVDLPSGSCAYAARRLQARRPHLAVVCGVNLPLLLDFIFHRELPLDQVVERLRARVGVSIEYSADADSSVPG